METFTCSGCNQTKPLTDFNKNRKRKNGHDNRCRECMKLAARMRETKRRGEFRRVESIPLDRQCSIEGCALRIKGHGYCSKHLQRYRTHGDPLGGAAFRNSLSGADFRPKGLTIEESFRWFMPDAPPAEGEQWIWSGPRDANGYGCFVHQGARLYAHRISYEMFVGPIPEGLVIRHKNDIPLDVNPHNLETGTRADNRQDCVDRNRAIGPRGEQQWTSKLTREQVDSIIHRYRTGGVTQQQLADEFSVYQSAISKIVNGQRWSY